MTGNAVCRVQETRRDVLITTPDVSLAGELSVPSSAAAVVIFAHGSGSSRHSPRNRAVAAEMRKAGLGALLFDLLTHEEESVDLFTRQFRFDIDLLARRLEGVTNWLAGQPDTEKLAVGYFGASTGAAAALVAAARLGERIGAVVSRGGRPDLAEPVLPAVKSPTLLIVGERDERVIELNERAYGLLRCEKDLRIVPRATHLFEEAGALEEVSRLAANWFRDHLHRIH